MLLHSSCSHLLSGTGGSAPSAANPDQDLCLIKDVMNASLRKLKKKNLLDFV